MAEPTQTGTPNETLYIFGLDGTDVNRKIIAFTPSPETFTNLNIPLGMAVWNYMSIIYVDQDTIYLTGGINSD